MDQASVADTRDLQRIYQVMDIVRGTTVDGPGLRTSIYLAGCTHRCPGCHNPSTWDENAGTPMTLSQIMDIVEEEDFDVTISGGDPFMHPEALALLARAVKRLGKNLWVYTGYTVEELQADPRLAAPLRWIDTLVDGPYIAELRDPDLLFRGSSNQRLINLI